MKGYLIRLSYRLWWIIRLPLKPFVMLENGASGDLFMAVHWTREWLMKQDWIFRKSQGCGSKWEDVLQEHYDKIRKALQDFKKHKK
jgi:hypothetical protein